MLHLLNREASRIYTYRGTHIVESLMIWGIHDLFFIFVSASIKRTTKFSNYSIIPCLSNLISCWFIVGMWREPEHVLLD